jgi:TP901 family phage tail tape measure protein
MSSKTLKASIIVGGSVSSAFRLAMSTTKNSLKMVGEEIARVEKRQRLLSHGIETFGKMGRSVDSLRRDYAGLTREADRLRVAQSRLASIQGRIEANSARRKELGGQFRGAIGTAGAMAAVAFMPIRQAVEFENAMLGVAKQVNGARDASGKLTPVYFDMARQIQRLGREIPMATNDIADMVTAGARMGIAREELIGFVRDASMMSTAFEAAPNELADSMGKIAGIFKIPVRAVGELGDAINHLDDNAMSKGSDIIRVLQGDMAGASTTMGLSAKNAAALASTFLHLGESAERADTAAAGMLRQLQVAKMNPKRFQVGVQMLGMTADQLQKGMVDDPQAMILDVLGRIKKLPVKQQMEAVTRLFGKDWGGAIAKLANGVDEYRRQLALANGEAAKGSMSREFQARMQTTGAQWQIMKNRMGELAVTVGQSLVPAVGSLMAAATPMIEGFAKFSRENPGVTKSVVGTALALSGLRVVTTGAAYALTALKGPVLSVMGFIARWRATNAVAAMGRFGPMAMRAAAALRTVGVAVAAISGGPIALAVAALTVGALVVRKYWQPIAAFVTGAFEGIRTAVGPAFAELGTALAPLKPAWDAVAGAVSSAFNWFMKLIQPVDMTSEQLAKAGNAGRTFGSIIGAVASFVVGRITSIIKAITWVTSNMGKVAKFAAVIPGMNVVGTAWNAAGSLLGGGDTAAPAPRLPRLPAPTRGKRATLPAVASGGRGAPVTNVSTHTYNITQRPGESPEALARRIEAERRKNEAVARRGSLVDAA